MRKIALRMGMRNSATGHEVVTPEYAVLSALRVRWKQKTLVHEATASHGIATMRQYRASQHAHIRALVSAVRGLREAGRDREAGAK